MTTTTPPSGGRAADLYDAIVIGSGLGGLSSAAYLAASGQRVALLERYSVLGGSSHVFRRQGRWEFDCGVHYVSECGKDGAVTAIMHGLGLDDRISWRPMDSDGFDRIVAPGFELATPFGWDSYLENLLAAFPGERAAVNRFHTHMRRIGEAIDRFTTQGTVAGMARWARNAGPSAAVMGMPYAAFLTTCGLSPRAVLALSTQCGALASSPMELPTAGVAAFLRDYVGTGSYYPQGGGQMLAAGFAEVVTAHRGDVRTNAEVSRIILDDGRAAGVELANGEVLRARSVVSDADAITTFSRLVGLENLPFTYRQRVKQWRMTRPLINGFIGVDYDVNHLPNSNYFAIPSWNDARSTLSLLSMNRRVLGGKGYSSGPAWARDLAERQPMFVQSSSRRDPDNRRAAPSGHSTIEVQTIVPYSPELWGFDGHDIGSHSYAKDSRYLEVKKIVLDGMLERMEQIFPGSSSKVKLAELGSPATQTRYVGNSGGAPFGLRHNLAQIGPMRPGTATVIPGLYYVGTNSPYGPGTVGAMISGVHAAAAVTGRDLVNEIRNGATIADTSSLAEWEPDFDPLAATRGLRPARSTATREPTPNASQVGQ